MNHPSSPHPPAWPPRCHELRFVSLHDRGRSITVPCDEVGHVDLDSLTQQARLVYLGARALIGRDYSYPTVHLLGQPEACG